MSATGECTDPDCEGLNLKLKEISGKTISICLGCVKEGPNLGLPMTIPSSVLLEKIKRKKREIGAGLCCVR